MDVEAINEEMRRTAVQKKAVTPIAVTQVLELAIAFFKERGYRSGKTGRPNQIFVMGGPEGGIPRVTGEVSARADVGKPGSTLVTLDGFGERLGPALAEFIGELRRQSKAAREAARAKNGEPRKDPNVKSV